MVERVAFFVDGFNLYHAIKRLRQPHLKWLNLSRLADTLISPQSESIAAIHYFSAYADWMPDQKRRHETYVRALRSVGVNSVMGQFKRKDRGCRSCGSRWVGHEEKETDVNIAIWLLNEAYKDNYDCAYIVSRDSDMVPAIRMVRSIFTEKKIIAVAPPHMGHSNDIISACNAKKKIKIQHLERSLFPKRILAPNGREIATRPAEYDP